MQQFKPRAEELSGLNTPPAWSIGTRSGESGSQQRDGGEWLLYAGVMLLCSVLLLALLAFLKRAKAAPPSTRRGDTEGGGLLPWRRKRARQSSDTGVPGLMISHSLPDLSRSVSKEHLLQAQEGRKVARQTTLPTVPQRHESFQRQLSHTLQLDSTHFSMRSLEQKNNLGQLRSALLGIDFERLSRDLVPLRGLEFFRWENADPILITIL
ncbi:hypothetical protein FHG87_006609 [Trinorchestia longiramus]|nr:hypothetical protein FHG87_006609 [Trinorchestia longiramus]